MKFYTDIVDELTDRIYNLISKYPEILDIDDVWGLYNIKEFYCSDLRPTLSQAQYSLAKAKKNWKQAELSKTS